MGRKVAWIVGAAVVLVALYAAPAHAQVSVSVGVGGPWFGAGVVVGGPVYGAPYPYYSYPYPYPYYYPYPVYSYPYPVYRYRYPAYSYRYPARYGRAYYGRPAGRQAAPYYRGAPGRYYNNGPGAPAQYRRGSTPAQRGNVPAQRGNAQAVRVARQR
jgi:hypothetical protein